MDMNTWQLIVIILMALVALLAAMLMYSFRSASKRDLDLREARAAPDRVREEERKAALERESRLRADFERARGVEIDNLMKAWKAETEMKTEKLVKQVRRDTSDRSRAVLKGKIGEQMAPLLDEFCSKYEISDARFIGDPIDYIIFRNLTQYKDEMKRNVPPAERSELEVVIADIKTGGAGLSTEQRRIRDAVKAQRVRWDEIRIGFPGEDIGAENVPPLSATERKD